ncbi:hypothetical protein [Lutibacter sp.]
MLKELFLQLFKKLANEPKNDKKSKNGNAIYFVEEILENRYDKINYISSKTIKSYYERFVEEKDNNAGEPASELKDYIANYLEYSNFSEFETTNSEKDQKKPFKKLKWILISVSFMMVLGFLYYNNSTSTNNQCLVWIQDHYKRIDCKGQEPNPLLNDVNIDKFKKIQVTKNTKFIRNGHPIIWYGKSIDGKLEYFNSRGVHPITLKELKPITKYMIEKYNNVQ